MSTQINITVDSGGLTDRAKQQQLAARQAQLEKERVLNLDAKALDKRAASQAAKGLSVTGQPLFSTGFTQPKVKRRPAANRLNGIIADYYVIKYGFTTGLDLDTRTTFVDDGIPGGLYIGWCREAGLALAGQTFLFWGGDNTGTGVETILFDRVKYEEITGYKSITLQLRAFWYSTVGNSVLISLTGYKGGQMVNAGFDWANPTATKVWEDFSPYESFAVQTNTVQCDVDGDFITYLKINYSTGKISYFQTLPPS